MTIREEIDRAGPVVDRLNAAIRDNPLAAGLIGAGVAWMLFGGTKGLGAAAGIATNVASRASAAASNAGSSFTGGLAKAGSKASAAVKDAASDVVGSIVPEMSMPETDKVLEAGSNAGSAIGDGFTSAVEKGRQYGTAFQSGLSQSLERQPLLLGAIGLAIGAGIASTFGSTAVESEWLGKQGAAAREKLQGLAGDIKDRAGKVMSDVKEEADRQGLTAGRAKYAASQVGEKVKTVAGAGRDSVIQR
jgi:hypothetical protein